jgi:hypothetical protein
MKLAAAACCVLLAACAAPSGLPPELVRAMSAPDAPRAPVRIEIDGAEIVTWAVPAAPAEIPKRAQRAIDAVVPGGTLHYAARCGGRHGPGWLVEKDYPPETGASRRAVWVSDAGEVLEQSHAIDPSASPAAVQRSLERGLGKALERLEFVQGRGPDRYRASADDGAVLEVAEDGRLLQRAVRSDVALDRRAGGWGTHAGTAFAQPKPPTGTR